MFFICKHFTEDQGCNCPNILSVCKVYMKMYVVEYTRKEGWVTTPLSVYHHKDKM